MTLRLIQLAAGQDRFVALLGENRSATRLRGVASTYQLALAAIREGQSLQDAVNRRLPTTRLKRVGVVTSRCSRTAMHASAVGNRRDKGMSHWGHEGLIKRWIGGIAIASPALAKLIEADGCEAYNLPQGVITQLYREIAAGRPGVITKVGLGTFVDPRVEGARMSPSSTDDLVQVIELAGEEWLFYPSFPVDVALIRGTVADENGMPRKDTLIQVFRATATSVFGRAPATGSTKDDGSFVIK